MEVFLIFNGKFIIYVFFCILFFHMNKYNECKKAPEIPLTIPFENSKHFAYSERK